MSTKHFKMIWMFHLKLLKPKHHSLLIFRLKLIDSSGCTKQNNIKQFTTLLHIQRNCQSAKISGNPVSYRPPSLMQPTQPYTGTPISFSQPRHIQAAQSHSANPDIYRQPNLIQPTQPYTGNPISFSQPSHIQATQSHSANPISFSQPSHIQATQSH